MLASRAAAPESSTGIPATGAATRRYRTALLVAAWVVGGAVLVIWFYYVGVRVFPGDSDGATVVLQGQSIHAGQLTLSGWRTLYDSFWTVDAPFYAIGVAILGVDPRLLYLVPAVLAAAVTVVGSWLARGERRGVPAAVAVVTVLGLLALPSDVWTRFFLRGPLHIGTVLWCLLAFAALRRGGWGWRWAAAVVLLAAGLLGDLLMLPLGVAPAFGAGVIAMLRTRDWRRGLPTVTAAVAGGVLAVVVRKIAELVGTYAIGHANPSADNDRMLANVKSLPGMAAALFGTGNGHFGPGDVPAALAAVHVVGLLAVTAAAVAAAVRLVRGAWTGAQRADDASSGWRLDDLLVLACLIDLPLFVVLTTSGDANFVRYLTPLVLFGAVLAGREAGRLVEAVGTGAVRRGGYALGVGVLACYLAAMGPTVTRAVVPYTSADVVRFLEAQGLHEGVGSYWEASMTTVAAHGDVVVRPVIVDDGTIVRYGKQSTRDWYSARPFRFLVYNVAAPWGGIDSASAATTFGPAARTYAVGKYRVLVWDHPISVAPDRYGG
ncbi:MAG TPA: hypothetical protein VH373_17275 [Jatrophihabitantaceae bacterium]|jgi:hypothetical protein